MQAVDKFNVVAGVKPVTLENLVRLHKLSECMHLCACVCLCVLCVSKAMLFVLTYKGCACFLLRHSRYTRAHELY